MIRVSHIGNVYLSYSTQYVGVAGTHRDVMELGGCLPMLEGGKEKEEDDEEDMAAEQKV
jgi:hypothetical protein